MILSQNFLFCIFIFFIHNILMLTEFLASDSWIYPQLNYLIWLQNIRISTGGIFDNFFLLLSNLGSLFFPTAFLCIIYWCINSKAGLYLLLLNCLTLITTHFIKICACVYRPWILSNNINPSDIAKATAGSYSFPSGHSSMAASTWGGIAFLVKKNHKILSVLLFLIVFLIAFSRNWLGVHTPQDVFIGLFIGFIYIFIAKFLINWCEKNRYLLLLFIINIISLLILFYSLTKNYPFDFVNGKILVNPKDAQYISVLYLGWILGILNGAFLCRKYFPFENNNISLKEKIARGCVGISIYYFLINNLYLFSHSYKSIFAYTFFVGFFITAIYPFIFSKIFLLKNFYAILFPKR